MAIEHVNVHTVMAGSRTQLLPKKECKWKNDNILWLYREWPDYLFRMCASGHTQV